MVFFNFGKLKVVLKFISMQDGVFGIIETKSSLKDILKLPILMIKSARDHAENFLEARVVPVLIEATHATSWTPPLFGFYKLNVDAGFYKKNKKASCEMVIRDHGVNVILSFMASFEAISSPLHAELRAILFGLETTYAEEMLAQKF